MAVDNRADVRAGSHDGQVQQDLAGPLALARDLLAVKIDDAQVVGLHEAFGHTRGSTEHAVFGELQADVAVIGRGESLVVDPATDLAHQLAHFPFIHCRAVADHRVPQRH